MDQKKILFQNFFPHRPVGYSTFGCQDRVAAQSCIPGQFDQHWRPELVPQEKGSLAPGDGKLSLQRIVYDFVSIINIFLWIGNGWRCEHQHLG